MSYLDVLDSLTLEKTVAELKKELEKSQERERALQSRMVELKALEVLPAKVDDLLRQVAFIFSCLPSSIIPYFSLVYISAIES